MQWSRPEDEESLIKLGRLSGGCIASLEKCRGELSGRLYALKTNPSAAMNEAERKGLLELSRCDQVRVPEVVAYGERELLLSFVPARKDSPEDQCELGQMLAALHKCRSEEFGLDHDNFIGETPQLNRQRSTNWAEFFWQSRLRPQWSWACKKGLRSSFSAKDLEGLVYQHLEEELSKQQKVFPSLLHGDLWSANWMASTEGVYLIDPASSYGHWEMEFAMIELFGGFSRKFFRTYEQSANVDLKTPEFEQRQLFYQAYHLYNHFNLFGGHYGESAERGLKSLKFK